MRSFAIDYRKLVGLLLPSFLRKSVLFALLSAMVRPVNTLFNAFTLSRNNNLYVLSKTGQVCYLRGMLNDAFDIEERRISISDIEYNAVIELWSDTDWETIDEPLKTYLYSDSDTQSVQLYGDGDSIGGDYAFYINVPFTLTEKQLLQLKNIVDRYRLASKKYLVRFT